MALLSRPKPISPPLKALDWDNAVITAGFALFGLTCLALLPFTLSETLKVAVLIGLLSMALVLNVYALVWRWPAKRRPAAGRWHMAIRLSANVAFVAFLLVNLSILQQIYVMRGNIGRMMFGLDFA